MMGLETIKDELYRCIGCTECYGRGPHIPFVDGRDTVDSWECPTLAKMGFVTYTGKGQQYLAREVAFGKMEIDEAIAQVFYSCPTCGICDDICPRPILETQKYMREEIHNRRLDLVPEANRAVDEKIRCTGNFFGGRPDKRGEWAKSMDLPKRAPVIFFAGCYLSYRTPQTARLAVKVLQKGGMNVSYLPEESCCGLHPSWNGNLELQRELAERNVKAIQESGAEMVVFSCPSCYKVFKVDYPAILGSIPFKVAHFVEVIDEMVKNNDLKFSSVGNVSFTYHDPCHLTRQHLGRRQALYHAPRRVLAAIPNLRLQEMKHHEKFSYCCGSGALVTQTAYPELTAEMTKVRLSEVREVAEAVVSACPHCVANFKKEAKKENGLDLAIYDFPEIIAAAVGVQ